MNRLFRRQGVVWPMWHRAWVPAPVGVGIVLLALALAACGSATSARPPSPAFTGYVWQVVAISQDGKVTSVPARLQVTLRFSPGGQFGANDSVNFHSGRYRPTGDGFTTGALSSTLAATSATTRPFCWPSARSGLSATASTRPSSLRSYTVTCQRRRPQADVPAPAFTGG